MRRISTAVTGGALAFALLGGAWPAYAQLHGLLKFVDLQRSDMIIADMTREQIVAKLAATAWDARPDLRDLSLSGLDLNGIDFRGARLNWTRLNDTDLSGADLSGVDLSSAWLMNATLNGADLSDSVLINTNLLDANLRDTVLDRALISADMTRADLRGASFRHANMALDIRRETPWARGTRMVGANADGADFNSAWMGGLNAEFASMRGSLLDHGDLRNAFLAGVDMTGASVQGLQLSGADLQIARLVDLRGEALGLHQALNLNRAVLFESMPEFTRREPTSGRRRTTPREVRCSQVTRFDISSSRRDRGLPTSSFRNHVE